MDALPPHFCLLLVLFLLIAARFFLSLVFRNALHYMCAEVPADVLMAVLCLVARLVSDIASCLGVSLPHPLSPAASMRYAAVAVDSSPRER